jgi:queuosine precursor transporter
VLGQLLDIMLFGLFRRMTRQRMLWLRATGSTLASQLVDTVVVNAVLLSGRKPLAFIVDVVRDSYTLKIAIAVALTPLIYVLHNLLMRLLGAGEKSGKVTT